MVRVTATAAFPAASGVYLFRNGAGKAIYVGKARSLRQRIRSHFANDPLDPKAARLLAATTAIETIVTSTEGEALNLENQLIKQLQPRYNVLLRDDSSYPYIKLAQTSEGLRVSVTRRKEADGARYFGPFFPAGLAHQLARLLRRQYLQPLMGPRLAPTAAGEMVRLLAGRVRAPLADFSRRMRLAAAAGRFEDAARWRRWIGLLQLLRQHSRAARMPRRDRTVTGVATAPGCTALTAFQFRGAKLASRWDLISRESVPLPSVAGAPAAWAAIARRSAQAVLDECLQRGDQLPATAILARRRGYGATIKESPLAP